MTRPVIISELEAAARAAKKAVMGRPGESASPEYAWAAEQACPRLVACIRSFCAFVRTHPLHQADVNTILARHGIVLDPPAEEKTP